MVAGLALPTCAIADRVSVLRCEGEGLREKGRRLFWAEYPKGERRGKMPLSKLVSYSREDDSHTNNYAYATRFDIEDVPRHFFPRKMMPKEAAYQFIHDELLLDANPRLNLASFCTTWMEPEAEKLMTEAFNKNFINMEEYPVATELQNRCVNMIADIFHAPRGAEGDEGQVGVGVGTVGSSEAVMLAGLAFKFNWRKKMIAKGKKPEELLKPNIVTGSNVQVVWEKFARYFDVELKEVKLTQGNYILDPVKAVEYVDENTIAVVGILGSTYDGRFEDIKLLNELLTKKNEETGWDTPIHVDAASGGFVAPFIFPDLEWDFRLPLVKSINVSGHKFGLVYPGAGWVVWRAAEDLPDELVFHISYLGTDQASFTLNFSRGASGIIGQYYQFIRLGFDGYKRVIANCWEMSLLLRRKLEELEVFEFLSDVDMGVPLVAFCLKDKSKFDEYDVADRLRMFGWTVPAYTMAPDAQNVTLLRAVIREDFSRSLADKLVEDIKETLKYLERHPLLKSVPQPPPKPVEGQPSKAVVRWWEAVDAVTGMSLNRTINTIPKTNGPC